MYQGRPQLQLYQQYKFITLAIYSFNKPFPHQILQNFSDYDNSQLTLFQKYFIEYISKDPSFVFNVQYDNLNIKKQILHKVKELYIETNNIFENVFQQRIQNVNHFSLISLVESMIKQRKLLPKNCDNPSFQRAFKNLKQLKRAPKKMQYMDIVKSVQKYLVQVKKSYQKQKQFYYLEYLQIIQTFLKEKQLYPNRVQISKSLSYSNINQSSQQFSYQSSYYSYNSSQSTQYSEHKRQQNSQSQYNAIHPFQNHLLENNQVKEELKMQFYQNRMVNDQEQNYFQNQIIDAKRQINVYRIMIDLQQFKQEVNYKNKQKNIPYTKKDLLQKEQKIQSDNKWLNKQKIQSDNKSLQQSYQKKQKVNEQQQNSNKLQSKISFLQDQSRVSFQDQSRISFQAQSRISIVSSIRSKQNNSDQQIDFQISQLVFDIQEKKQSQQQHKFKKQKQQTKKWQISESNFKRQDNNIKRQDKSIKRVILNQKENAFYIQQIQQENGYDLQQQNNQYDDDSFDNLEQSDQDFLDYEYVGHINQYLEDNSYKQNIKIKKNKKNLNDAFYINQKDDNGNKKQRYEEVIPDYFFEVFNSNNKERDNQEQIFSSDNKEKDKQEQILQNDIFQKQLQAIPDHFFEIFNSDNE